MASRVLLVEHDTTRLYELAQRLRISIKSSWINDADFKVELANHIALRKEAKDPDVIPYEDVEVIVVTEPNEILKEITDDFDLVVSDVNFLHSDVPVHQGTAYSSKIEDNLRLILETVAKAEESLHFEGRAFPVVVYTSMNAIGGMDQIKGFLDKLYDVWDKAAAPDFVAWNLRTLARRLRSGRPGSSMARHIVAQSDGAPWHNHVIEMAKGYVRAGTAAMQVAAVENPIVEIANSLELPNAGQQLWKAFSSWEPVGMGASLGNRAHVRHAINVFWLGYCILNNPLCQKVRAWIADQIKREMPRVGAEYIEGEIVNAAWFLTATFHDSGQSICEIEKLLTVQSSRLVGLRKDFADEVSACARSLKEKCKISVVQDCVKQLPCLAARITNDELDHGVVGGAMLAAKVLIIDKKTGEPISAICKAASKAIMAHNLIADPRGHISLEWHVEPLSCLLALCDQIQAWDREYEIEGGNVPRKVCVRSAELLTLDITAKEKKPLVSMMIDYVVPDEARSNWRQLRELRRDLESVLLKNPIMVIKDRLTGDQPFGLHVEFALGGVALPCKIDKA